MTDATGTNAAKYACPGYDPETQACMRQACECDAADASSNRVCEHEWKAAGQIDRICKLCGKVETFDPHRNAIPNSASEDWTTEPCEHCRHVKGDFYCNHCGHAGKDTGHATRNSAAEPGQAHRTVVLVCAVEYKDWQIDELARQFVRALESTISRWPEVTIQALRIDADATRNSAATIRLDDAERIVREIAEQKAASGSKAQAANRWEVADHRFEEARVLIEDVIPALRKAAT